MQIFGGSDLGWRLYEFFLLGMMTLALVLLTRRWDWLAGVFASGMFMVVHSAEGPQYAGERELTLTVLLLFAYVALFAAVDRERPWIMTFFGLASGLAISIKPTFLPLPIALLFLAAIVLRQGHKSVWAAFSYALAGMGAIACLVLEFLEHYRVFGAFRFVVTKVLPAYVGLAGGVSFLRLLAESLPKLAWPLLVVAVPLTIVNVQRFGRWSWQQWSFLVGALFGLLSFLAQHKGFLHHRYTLLVFFYLLVGLAIFRALHLEGWPRWLAAFALLFALLIDVPRTLRFTHQAVGHGDLELALESDLTRLGGTPVLQDKVQCFDLVFGCLDALYHLRLVENSGFTGDLLFFPERDSEATEYYRQRFWRAAAKDPAEVIVLSNQNLSSLNDFDKVRRWPEFAAWLAANYKPVVERRFQYEHFGGRFETPVKPKDQDGYRIYLRNGSALQRPGATLATMLAPGQS